MPSPAGHFTRFNPLAQSGLTHKSDLHDAVRGICAPLWQHSSPGQTRLTLGVNGAVHSNDAAAIEANLRPLWGIVPTLAGGGEIKNAERYINAFEFGTDPEHPEFWGHPHHRDQRFVEMASIAAALLLAPDFFWQPLSGKAKANLSHWLDQINHFEVADNNWLFFRALVNVALCKLGQKWNKTALISALDRLEEFYIGDGHYTDGIVNRNDYYSGMGFHFYGLILAQIGADIIPDYAQHYRERAHLFARDFQYWFAKDGAAIPFGRSLVYRFAQSAFWSACVFADEQTLSWSEIKALLLGNLRWWGQQPIFGADGILSIGYAYPNLNMTEVYNAPGSPYWALKTFLINAAPDDPPFWQCEEKHPDLPQDISSKPGGFIARQRNKETSVLFGGQDGRDQRHSGAKYARFAYSTAHGISVAYDAGNVHVPDFSKYDSGLAISLDGETWRARDGILNSGIIGEMAWGEWTPNKNVSITTWLDFASDGWHLRFHSIKISCELSVYETGFSLPGMPDETLIALPTSLAQHGASLIENKAGISVIASLNTPCAPDVVRAPPNTNLQFPTSCFPGLKTKLKPGEYWLASAAYADQGADKRLKALKLSSQSEKFCRENKISLALG